jgi:hypothetical protein
MPFIWEKVKGTVDLSQRAYDAIVLGTITYHVC